MEPHQPLTTIGAVAKALNAGHAPEQALTVVAQLLAHEVMAEWVAVWFRQPHGTTFRAARASTSARAGTSSTPGDGNYTIQLVHEGQRLGVLEVGEMVPDPASTELLRVAADVLGPYLASIELSEDLAYEVELRSREIEEQRQFTGLIIDTLPVGLYVIDREYRIQAWNRKRETGTQGLRREDVIGRPIFDVLSRQPAEQLKAEFDHIFETGEVRQMDLETHTGGEARIYRISKLPMRLASDAITHIITIGEDVTAWRAVQQQIMQSEKLAAIGQLAAGIMHEINNPLATIGACVAAIGLRLEEQHTEAARSAIDEYLHIMDNEVERCSKIADQLLAFSRPKGTVKRPVRVGAVVEETLFLLKHHPRLKQMEVERTLDPDLPPVQGSAEQLVQVFMALILNGLDAIEEGGQLSVRTRRNPSRADEVIVEFEDTGVGISSRELSKIFEPFYTTKPPGRGTGLGLSICYGIVEDHRGRIEVDSQVGRGSVFRVYLPVSDGR